MRRILRPRSTTFRIVLAMALLAWTAFACEAIAHPFVMGGQMQDMAANVSGQAMPPHCKGMPSPHAASVASTPAPHHPVPVGHGCCAFGHCDCASPCSSVMGVPLLALTWPPLRDPALVPIRAGVLLATATPHLRPPIA